MPRSSTLRCTLIAAALCSALAGPPQASAAALGDAIVRSSLGQPLDADIEFAALTAAEADALVVRIAPPELFAEAGIDYTGLVRSMRVALERRGDRHLIRVRSDLPVNDPYVMLLIELNSGGSRMVRQYALLVDPPAIYTPGSLTPPAPVAVAPQSQASPPATGAAPGVPAAQAAPSKVMVRPRQTMNSIATSVQPEGVRLEQVLVAFQQANPDAFVGRNINRVRSGAVLQVPDPEAMRAIDPATAMRTVRAQTADFIRYQRALAERVSRTAATGEPVGGTGEANRSSRGQVGVQLAEPGAGAQSRDRLTLSSPEHAGSAAAAVGSTEPLDKIASEKALAEANSRIAALEKSINDMQQLLALQNKALADAQQRAGEAARAPVATEPAASDAEMKATSPDSAAPAEGPAPDSASAGSAQESGQTPVQVPAGPAAPSDPAGGVGTGPVAGPGAAPSEAEDDGWAPAAAGSWLARLQDPLARAGLAAALLLPLLAWLAWRQRRRKPTERPADVGAAAMQTVVGDAGGQHIDTTHSVFHSNFVPSVSQLDALEVDALAEADVYIAYGRDVQAEEILLDALRTHPERHALRVKLLEIYAARQDRAKFDKLAAELRVLTHGRGDDWAQAARLGQVLEPENRLYGSPDESEGGVPKREQSAAERGTPDRDPSSAADSPVADFQLRLEGLLGEQRRESMAPPPAMQPTPPSAAPDFGLSGITSAKPDSGSPRIEPVLDNDADVAALTTKLDLALACHEIGDKDGARELLAEVAGARNPALAERAQSLLKQLA